MLDPSTTIEPLPSALTSAAKLARDNGVREWFAALAMDAEESRVEVAASTTEPRRRAAERRVTEVG